jgi:hypothetical protein
MNVNVEMEEILVFWLNVYKVKEHFIAVLHLTINARFLKYEHTTSSN